MAKVGTPVIPVLVAVVWIVALAPSASAQKLEFSLFAGVRAGGEFSDETTGATRWLDGSASFGLIVGRPLGNGQTLELAWSHQDGRIGVASAGESPVDLDLDTLTFGGTYEWEKPHSRPFVSGGVGFTVLSPETAGYDRDMLLALTLGGGVKLALSQRLALRLEARGIATLAIGGTAGICGGGGCAVSISGSGIGQIEALAGLTWSPR